MRVALLNPCYPPEVNRGAERVIGELADGLLSRGHEPRVITSHRGGFGRTLRAGVPVWRSWRPPEGLLVRRGYQEHLTHVPFTYAALLRGSDDLAHAHYPTDALAALRWGARRRKPVVFTYHGIPQRRLAAGRRLRLRALTDTLRESREVVVSSRAAADAMARWFGIRPEPVHPAVHPAFFAADVARAEAPTIVSAADSGDGRKRIPMLVRAFAGVRRQRPDARLFLCAPRDRSLADGLRAEPGVELFDPLDDPAALAQLYGTAWVSALVAYSEAFGLVLAEALACGTPVVGTRDGGIPEIVSDERLGRLFDLEDEEGLVRSLLDALEMSEDDSIRLECRRSAARFSTERFMESHLSIYADALG